MTGAADARWMTRAIRVASTALGTTWPNPAVGCVLVRDGHLLGSGATGPRISKGQLHAEVAALADAQRQGFDPRGATAYVTLAPCTARSVPGDTACAPALIAAGIARVVVGVEDPHQPASREAFGAAGIVWQSGVLAEQAQHLHGGFLRRMTDKRPRFTGKWAMTLDGCLATGSGHSGWISHPEALALSRRRRRAFDAILIGGGTARTDDPSLLASRPRRRLGSGTPLRVVVSRNPDLAEDARLLTTLDQAPLLVVHDPATDIADLKAWGADGLAMEDLHDLVRLGRTLGGWGLNEVLVEGGARLHAAFLAAGLYERLEIYQGGVTLGGGLPVAQGPGVSHMADGLQWVPETAPRLLGSTILSRWKRA